MRLLAATIATATLLLAGCGDDSTDTSASDTTAVTTAAVASTTSAGAAAGATRLELVDSSFGKILADGDGNTLYAFLPDTGDTSACTGGCSAAWPPVAGPATGDGVDAGDLGTITRDDGTKQATFYGHPVYRYASDSAPGDVNGQGVNDKWYVIGADGNPVKDAAAAPSTTAKSGY